ncbi:MAG TPA: hypothetical protein VGC58_02950 [Candidatus Paceibacterota bacterium]
MVYREKLLFMATFAELTKEKEVNLRGYVIMLSADLEFVLLKVIVACLADVPNEKARQFKSLPLEAKITMLKHDLKKYFPKHYLKYHETIKDLERIKKFRNKFAHCKIEWDKKKDVSFFYILIISEVKGLEKPQLVKMSYNEYNKNSTKMLKVIFSLTKLCTEIEAKFKSSYPHYFNFQIKK